MPRRLALCLLALLAAAGPAPAQLSAGPAPVTTEAFRQRAIATNAFEIETSRLALSRSSNPRIRNFARRIIREQAAASRALGGSKPEADPRRAAAVAELTPLRGRPFDAAYARLQVTALEETVGLYAAYAQAGTDPQLRALAQTTLPRLQQQLTFARRLVDAAR